MRGELPPVSTTCPPARAASARRSATTCAGSSTTTMSISLATFCKLPCPRHRRLNRVQERRPHSRLLELANRGDRRASRRGDGLAQLHRVHLLVAQLLGGAEHRLDHERRRDLP